MSQVLYICASQFSGSTLATFVLNDHGGIATVGHTTGWPIRPDEDFRCSCGETLEACPFYRTIAHAFHAQGLPFDVHDFGTAYSLNGNERLNRLLTGALPKLRFSVLERVRDALVRQVPSMRRTLARQDLANATFMTSAMSYSGASVFLDNSHDPFRLRHLRRLSDLELRVIHLVRDPRGVVCSMMRHAGWDAALSIRLWLRRQLDIIRLAGEHERTLRVHYESLCTDIDPALARIYDFAGLEPKPFDGDFKAREHHILGNAMRFGSGEIRLDERWRRELSPDDLRAIDRIAGEFVHRHPSHPLSDIVTHYLG